MAHTIDHNEEEVRGIWRHIEEKSNNVLNTGKKVIPFAQKVWEGTKEFKDNRNPLNWGHNVGAVGARGVESFFTFDANNPKELSMELVEKAMGKKGIHYSIAKEVPGLKTVLVQAEDLAGQALTSIRKRANTLIQGSELQPALARAGGSNVLQATTEMPPGGFARGKNTVERVTDPVTGRLKGQEQVDAFRKAAKSGDEKALIKSLDTVYANALDARYVDGRGGFYNIKRLVKDDKLVHRIVSKQDEIAQAHYKLSKNPKNDTLRRDLYELVGDTYFNEDLVVYGKSGFKKTLIDTTNWLSGDQWHHIFGNREAAEFMLNAVARDPLVGVNLAKLMKKLNLTSAGVADNLMLMKKVPHGNLHEVLRKLGIDPNYGRMGPADFADFSHAISEMATKGHRYGPKVFDPKTGESLAGKFVPPDPSYVNELFGMVEAYAKANKSWRKLIQSGGVSIDPNLKRIVPKGTPGSKFYDFKGTKNPEVLADKIGRVLKALESFEDLPLTLPKV